VALGVEQEEERDARELHEQHPPELAERRLGPRRRALVVRLHIGGVGLGLGIGIDSERGGARGRGRRGRERREPKLRARPRHVALVPVEIVDVFLWRARCSARHRGRRRGRSARGGSRATLASRGTAPLRTIRALEHPCGGWLGAMVAHGHQWEAEECVRPFVRRERAVRGLVPCRAGLGHAAKEPRDEKAHRT
jgi:hypothetical protein